MLGDNEGDGAPSSLRLAKKHNQPISWGALRPRQHNLREWLRSLAGAIDRQNWFAIVSYRLGWCTRQQEVLLAHAAATKWGAVGSLN